MISSSHLNLCFRDNYLCFVYKLRGKRIQCIEFNLYYYLSLAKTLFIRMVRKRSLKVANRENMETKAVATEQENVENPPKRRSTRVTRSTASMAEEGCESPEKISKKELQYIKYNGLIKYYTDGNEIAEASDSIMQWVDMQTEMEVVPMAFDMEWPFSFKTGPGKSAVIQLCVEENCCYIFQLTNVKKLPAALMALLKHTKVRLHGVNIKNDLRKLARDYPEVNADVLIEKCIDLGVWCNQVYETGGRWSLERLTNFICELAMDKSKKVRMSKWHVIPLDENQLMYAAIDVYIGQLIYRKIDNHQKTKQKNEEDFLTKNGQEAFKAIKALGETFINI